MSPLQPTQKREATHRKGKSMTDDRTETITDPAEIRATDEPDERTPNEVHVDESGCSCKTGPYRGFQRDPIDAACPKHGGPLRHGDGDVTVCHPDGSTTIIREPDERGDFPCCATPAPVGAAVALDLDCLAQIIEDKGVTTWSISELEYVYDVQNATADEVIYELWPALVAEVVTLRAKVAAVEALVRDWPCSDDTCDGDCTGCAYASDLRAALATTGEGE